MSLDADQAGVDSWIVMADVQLKLDMKQQTVSKSGTLSLKVKVKSLSRIRLFATPWTLANQAPLSMEFSRQAYWSRVPLPSPGDLPNPGIESRSPTLQADALPSEPPGKPLALSLLLH